VFKAPLQGGLFQAQNFPSRPFKVVKKGDPGQKIFRGQVSKKSPQNSLALFKEGSKNESLATKLFNLLFTHRLY